MGTTNFDIVDASAIAVSGTNVITAVGSAASVAWVNSDAPNNNARLNAIVSELTNIGLLA